MNTMTDIENAISDTLPIASYISWFLNKNIGVVRYAETSRGLLAVIAPNNFFRDIIKTRFLMQILEAVKPLGFKYVEIIKIDDQPPTFQPKELEPEEWDNVQRQIHTMRVVVGIHKKVEARKAEVVGSTPNPSYVYRGTEGLNIYRQEQTLEEETLPSDGSLEQEGCYTARYIATGY